MPKRVARETHRDGYEIIGNRRSRIEKKDWWQNFWMFDTEIINPAKRILCFFGDKHTALITHEVGCCIAQGDPQCGRESKKKRIETAHCQCYEYHMVGDSTEGEASAESGEYEHYQVGIVNANSRDDIFGRSLAIEKNGCPYEKSDDENSQEIVAGGFFFHGKANFEIQALLV